MLFVELTLSLYKSLLFLSVSKWTAYLITFGAVIPSGKSSVTSSITYNPAGKVVVIKVPLSLPWEIVPVV